MLRLARLDHAACSARYGAGSNLITPLKHAIEAGTIQE
jgi:hypothetical protein